MGPFKCPECGIWWAGLEHRCRPLPPTTDTAGMVNDWLAPRPGDEVLWCVDLFCSRQSVRHVKHPAPFA